MHPGLADWMPVRHSVPSHSHTHSIYPTTPNYLLSCRVKKMCFIENIERIITVFIITVLLFVFNIKSEEKAHCVVNGSCLGIL